MTMMTNAHQPIQTILFSNPTEINKWIVILYSNATNISKQIQIKKKQSSWWLSWDSDPAFVKRSHWKRTKDGEQAHYPIQINKTTKNCRGGRNEVCWEMKWSKSIKWVSRVMYKGFLVKWIQTEIWVSVVRVIWRVIWGCIYRLSKNHSFNNNTKWILIKFWSSSVNALKTRK
jgi:hypothetical protein